MTNNSHPYTNPGRLHTFFWSVSLVHSRKLASLLATKQFGQLESLFVVCAGIIIPNHRGFDDSKLYIQLVDNPQMIHACFIACGII